LYVAAKSEGKIRRAIGHGGFGEAKLAVEDRLVAALHRADHHVDALRGGVERAIAVEIAGDDGCTLRG
jgi:hypothetical protein